MTAEIIVDPTRIDLAELIALAGGDPKKSVYLATAGVLMVADVEQAALDAALAAYDHTAVAAKKARAQALAALTATDTGMARVAEDLIDVLVTAGTITEAALPQALKDKISNRKALRASI